MTGGTSSTPFSTSRAPVVSGDSCHMIFLTGKQFTPALYEGTTRESLSVCIPSCISVRVHQGRNPEPSAGIIDSQSVKIVANIGYSGFDGAKKVNGRKRHIVTDTLGLLLEVVVHEANLSDRVSAETVLAKVHVQFKRIKTIFADQGYTGKLIVFARTTLYMTIEIIKRTEVRSFHILP